MSTRRAPRWVAAWAAVGSSRTNIERAAARYWSSPFGFISCSQRAARAGNRSAQCRHRSVVRPHAGRGQLEQVSIGVPEVKTPATQVPGATLHDRHAPLRQTTLPRCQLGCRDGEGKVQLTVAVVRTGTESHGSPFAEQQEDLAGSDRERRQSLAFSDWTKTKEPFIELARSANVADVDRGLEDAGH